MMIALTSAKHAPGVTTAAFGLASGWPRPVLLAECDPAGADLASWLPQLSGGGLVDALLELRRTASPSPDLLWQMGSALNTDGTLRLLAGLDDPNQAATLAGMWPLLASALANVTDDQGAPVDVVVDAGRLSDAHTPWPLLEAADVVALVVRPDVAGVRLASRWIRVLRDRLGDAAGPGGELRLLVIGDKPYPADQVAAALETPLLAALPHDPAAAAALSGGGGRGLSRSRLWRTLTAAADSLTVANEAASQSPVRQSAGAAADDLAVPVGGAR